MPQRKLSLEPIIPIEKDLATKTFGENNMFSNLTHYTVSFPLIIFCNERKNQAFFGDSISGFSAEFCNQFFPAPTDVGICLSKNLNIKKIFNVNDDYTTFMEVEHQKSGSLIGMSSYLAQSTYVLTTTALNVKESHECDIMGFTCTTKRYATTTPRNSNKNFNIQMQIHQNKSLGNILDDKNVNLQTKSITLKPGYEYTIEVFPTGQESSNGFKKLSFEQRSCRLDHEIPEGSSFKVYSKTNCLYDCYIAEAFQKCQCIPWDFIHNIKESNECDIFGRTCFMNVFENSTQFPKNLCPFCIKECDMVEFKRKILSVKKIETSEGESFPCSGESPCSEYLCYG